jgi:hypothetical protein
MLVNAMDAHMVTASILFEVSLVLLLLGFRITPGVGCPCIGIVGMSLSCFRGSLFKPLHLKDCQSGRSKGLRQVFKYF